MKNYYNMKALILSAGLSILGFTGTMAQTAIPGTIDATVGGEPIVTTGGAGALSYQIDVAEAGDYYLELKYSSDLPKDQIAEGLLVNVDGNPVLTAEDQFVLLSTIVEDYQEDTGDVDAEGNPILEPAPQFLWSGLLDATSGDLGDGTGVNRTIRTIPLAAGVQTLSFDLQAGGWELEAIRLLKEQVPYSGAPMEVGPNGTFTIEAENYDEGPQGVSYGDSGWGNRYGFYRGDGVDIGDGATGFVMANIVDSEWAEYTINVLEAGDYTLNAYYSTGVTDGSAGIDISSDGTPLESFLLPFTAEDGAPAWQGWRNYETVSTVVTLAAGVQVIRLDMVKRLNLDYISLTNTTSTGINDNVKDSEVLAFPNPSASGIFNLAKSLDYVVYSSTGAEVLAGKGSQINLSDLPKGLYILKAGQKTVKLLFR